MTTHSPSMIERSDHARLVPLFLRSRRAGWAALYLIGIAALIAGLRSLVTATGAFERDPFEEELLVAMQLVFVPLASALVVGVGAHGPFGELERTVSRSLPVLRFGHLAGLLLIGGAALYLLTLQGEPSEEPIDMGRLFLRNLAGFAGLALLTAPVVGARLSWLLPFGYGVVAFWMGVYGDDLAWWLWPMQPLNNDVALGIALGLLAAGVAAAVLFGARDSKDEAE